MLIQISWQARTRIKMNSSQKRSVAGMNKQSSLLSRGVTTETLTMIRSRFILEWFDKYASRFPYKLFDYQRQLLQEGHVCRLQSMVVWNSWRTWLLKIAGLKTHERERNIKTSLLFKKQECLKCLPGNITRIDSLLFSKLALRRNLNISFSFVFSF